MSSFSLFPRPADECKSSNTRYKVKFTYLKSVRACSADSFKLKLVSFKGSKLSRLVNMENSSDSL